MIIQLGGKYDIDCENGCIRLVRVNGDKRIAVPSVKNLTVRSVVGQPVFVDVEFYGGGPSNEI